MYLIRTLQAKGVEIYECARPEDLTPSQSENKVNSRYPLVLIIYDLQLNPPPDQVVSYVTKAHFI